MTILALRGGLAERVGEREIERLRERRGERERERDREGVRERVRVRRVGCCCCAPFAVVGRDFVVVLSLSAPGGGGLAGVGERPREGLRMAAGEDMVGEVCV